MVSARYQTARNLGAKPMRCNGVANTRVIEVDAMKAGLALIVQSFFYVLSERQDIEQYAER